MKAFTGFIFAAAVAFAGGTALAKPVKYRCQDGSRVTARFSDDASGHGSVVLSTGTAKTTLPQVLSADGGRYASDGVEFWIKGKSATFTRPSGSTTCATR